MNAIKIKKLLLDKGLSIKSIAIEFHKDSHATVRSLETMVSDTLYGKRFYPTIAEKLRSRYGINIDRPPHLQGVRRQLKQAA